MEALSKLGLPKGLVELQAAKAKASSAAQAEAGTAPDKLREMAEEFEQIFLQTMLSEMMEGTTPEAPFNGGAGEDQWKGFLTNEYAGALSKGGGIGLADSIYADLVALQTSK